MNEKYPLYKKVSKWYILQNSNPIQAVLLFLSWHTSNTLLFFNINDMSSTDSSSNTIFYTFIFRLVLYCHLHLHRINKCFEVD